jgi:IS605 OrfB family transposase
MGKVCRIVESVNLNVSKLAELSRQAKLLGNLRKEIWQRFGSVSGSGVNHRVIRDGWVKTRDFSPLPAKAWKETLRNVLDDINMYEKACKHKVTAEIYRRYKDKDEQKKLIKLLFSDDWASHSFLSRGMRRHKKHGKTSVDNQIILESGVYGQFTGVDGNTWLKVPSFIRGKPVAVPLNSNIKLKGTLRLVIKEDSVEIHFAIDQKSYKPCGTETVGSDKGYTEAFVDNDGEVYGEGFGKVMTAGTKVTHAKGIARNKLHSLHKNHKNPSKKRNILKYNLGQKEQEKRNKKQQKKLRDIAFKAVHKLVDKAAVIVAEDLSSPMKSRQDRGKDYNRRMNSWAKSYLAEALDTVTEARGSSLQIVNAAYTSQMDSISRRLEGRREGDKFYHANGDVSHADTNAAKNILHRLDDTEIKPYMPHGQVKKILQDRLLASGGVTKTSASDRPSRTPVTRRKRTLTENEVTDKPNKNGR